MSCDVLVTGAAGLVGGAVVALLGGRKVVGIDRDEVDLLDTIALSKALAELAPKHVIHCAAYTSVDRAESERELVWRTNVDATATIARYAASNGARLVYVSTDYVFDGKLGRYKEDAAISPQGVYARSKAAGELAVQMLAPAAVIARTSVPFGPYAGGRKDFVQWLRDELEAKKPVRIVGDQISNPTYVPKLAAMLIALVDGGVTGIVHTAGKTSLDRFTFAQQIAQRFALDSALISRIQTADLQQAAPRPLDASLDVSRAAALHLDPLFIDQALALLPSASPRT